MKTIGVLALQGGFQRHKEALERLGHRAQEIRAPEDLAGVRGLVLPGGESSVMRKLLVSSGLEGPLGERIRDELPVLGTCAGLILLSRGVRGEPALLGALDVVVRRNAWGRQVESVEATSDRGLALLFIRAPRIEEVGDRAEVLDRFQGEAIWVRQGPAHGVSFHPELGPRLDVHEAAFGAAALSSSRAPGSRAGADR